MSLSYQSIKKSNCKLSFIAGTVLGIILTLGYIIADEFIRIAARDGAPPPNVQVITDMNRVAHTLGQFHTLTWQLMAATHNDINLGAVDDTLRKVAGAVHEWRYENGRISTESGATVSAKPSSLADRSIDVAVTGLEEKMCVALIQELRHSSTYVGVGGDRQNVKPEDGRSAPIEMTRGCSENETRINFTIGPNIPLLHQG